mmetsp:Transcript_48024/g.121191  ORF Transcript_48024/g.121191 Transcript_48024/m.121191 type:complete len:252 (-) Transcript_48024:726-1481(-)
MSSWYRARQSAASLQARTTASGSSALACSTGMPRPLAMSVQYMVERPSAGAVVNPIWLLTTRCMVPPMLVLCSLPCCSPSATTPSPEKEASPWRMIAACLSTPEGPARSCIARTMPATTVLTASRWLGLGATLTRTFTPCTGSITSPSVPRWYFTSPTEKLLWLPSISAQIFPSGLPSTLCSTLRRPRCAMPIWTLRTPWVPSRATAISSPGTSASQPSIPKRLDAGNFCPRKASMVSERRRPFSRSRRME